MIFKDEVYFYYTMTKKNLKFGLPSYTPMTSHTKGIKITVYKVFNISHKLYAEIGPNLNQIIHNKVILCKKINYLLKCIYDNLNLN